MVKIYKRNIRNFLAVFILCFAFFLLCRFILGEKFDFSKDLGYVVAYSALYAITSLLWPRSRWYFILSFIFVFLHLTAAWLKIWYSMLLPEREVTHTICYSINLFADITILYYIAGLIKFGTVCKVAKSIVSVLYACCLLPVLTIIGYALVNNSLFSSDVIMALFQTNSSETLDYLRAQNLALWAAVFVGIIAVIALQIYLLTLLRTKLYRIKVLILALAVAIWATATMFPKLNLNYVHNLVLATHAELQGFSNFKQKRDAKLSELQKLHLSAPSKGVYVLVIGESLSKDHMQMYGYLRSTTPWLTEFSRIKNTVAFNNAYANHTHTVPALSYALSEKNQYNDFVLDESASIIDVARATGYKTYWLSNQLKYSVTDTPVNIIGATADKSEWINSSVGEKLSTSFYDEKLLDYLPDIRTTDKALIVIHLIGNHNIYKDRYPKKFEKFRGSDDHSIDEYDNSILYNDHVVSEIYKRVSKNPYFMAFVYFADHGDDADNNLGHNSSLFSYPMARIPLVVNVSNLYVRYFSPILNNLRHNQNAYWTNDLLYDLMVGLMQIKGLPFVYEPLNLASDQYYLPKNKVLLLHGAKNLSAE